MTLTQTKASRALWRRREVSYYKKWHHAKSMNHKDERSYWWGLYIEARDQRRHRDRQLASLRENPTHVSDAGVALVAGFEGFVPHPYRDPVGVWTIGYGETLNVGPNTPNISEPAARLKLRRRLNNDYVPAVLAAGKGKLNQNQIDAFASFVYNCGPGAVSTHTTVGQRLRKGNLGGAANALLAWCKAGGRVLPGLLARRKRERALALK